METALFYFNSLASIIIILDSISSFFNIKLVHIIAFLPKSKSIPEKYKHRIKANTYICLLLLFISLITLPIATIYTYIHFGFSQITINRIIIDITLIAVILIDYKLEKHPFIAFSYRNFTLFFIFINIVSTIALAAWLYPSLKFIH